MLNCPRLAIDVQHLTSDICRQAVFSFHRTSGSGGNRAARAMAPCSHSTNTPARESNKSTINHINQVVHDHFTHFQLTRFLQPIMIKSAGFRLLPPVPGCILRQLWAVKRCQTFTSTPAARISERPGFSIHKKCLTDTRKPESCGVKQCHKPPMTGNGNHTSYKNGDFPGGCFMALFYPH